MASADESTGEFCQTFKEELTPILKLIKNQTGKTSKLILQDQHHQSQTKTIQEKKTIGQYL